MGFIKLRYHPNEREYQFVYFDPSDNLGILAMFLSIEVRCQTKFWKYIEDERCLGVGGELTRLEKDGDQVIISEVYPETEGKPRSIVLSQAEFAKLLKTWLTVVCEKRPSEVIISQEDHQLSIQTRD